MTPKAPLTLTFRRLRQLRKDHHLSQIQLADAAGIASGTIAAWESGRVQDLGLDTIRKLAPVFGMTTADLARYLTDAEAEHPYGKRVGDGFGRPATPAEQQSYRETLAKIKRLLDDIPAPTDPGAE